MVRSDLLRVKRVNWYQRVRAQRSRLSPQHPECQAPFFGQPAQRPAPRCAGTFCFTPQHLFVPTGAAWAGERQGTSGSRGLPQLRLLLPSGTSDTPEQRAGSSCHQPGRQRGSPQHPARHKPRGLRSHRRAPCCSVSRERLSG